MTHGEPQRDADDLESLFSTEGPVLPMPLGDRYELIKRIGFSDETVTFRAADTKLGRSVAIKIPRGLEWDRDGEWSRSIREARLVAGLDHPGIVPVYDADTVQGISFVAMPFIEGRTWDRYVEETKADPERVMARFLDVCAVVGFIHDSGRVHRNLKPSNIMVDGTDTVRLLDFRLACSREGADAVGMGGRTCHRMPGFSAPEEGFDRPDSHEIAAIDVYSLGIILHLTARTLAGAPVPVPWEPPEPTSAPTEADLKGALGPLGSLAQVISGCLQQEPGLRPANAAKLGHEIRRARQGSTSSGSSGPRPESGRTSVGGWLLRWTPALGIGAIALAILGTIQGRPGPTERSDQVNRNVFGTDGRPMENLGVWDAAGRRPSWLPETQRLVVFRAPERAAGTLTLIWRSGPGQRTASTSTPVRLGAGETAAFAAGLDERLVFEWTEASGRSRFESVRSPDGGWVDSVLPLDSTPPGRRDSGFE
ncbi:MAG: serine/threonine protein kinase [Limisphaerales bacterium]